MSFLKYRYMMDEIVNFGVMIDDKDRDHLLVEYVTKNHEGEWYWFLR